MIKTIILLMSLLLGRRRRGLVLELLVLLLLSRLESMKMLLVVLSLLVMMIPLMLLFLLLLLGRESEDERTCDKKVTLVNLGSVVPLAMFLILTFLFLPKALHCFSCFCMSVESIERVECFLIRCQI